MALQRSEIEEAVVALGSEPGLILNALRSALVAACEWRDTGKAEPLERFAQALLAATELHLLPGYDKARQQFPAGPRGPVHDLEEVLAARGL